MKVSRLVHNPGAGEEKYTSDQLVSIIEAEGFECRYSSTKKKVWKKIDPDTDFLVIAGGDGTVRNVARELLRKRILRKRLPLALLPLGTANNISKTLGIAGEPAEIVKTWKPRTVKKFDVGIIHGLEETTFFLEGFGYGIFPLLMKKMKSTDDSEFQSPEDELKYSLQVLHDLILSYEAEELELEVDGVSHSGKYLMAEVMNIRSIGPNLQLAPDADPGDGLLEVVLVSDTQRSDLATYVLDKLNGRENPYVFNAIKATSIRMRGNASYLHIDDELIKLENAIEIDIDLFHGLLKFLIS